MTRRFETYKVKRNDNLGDPEFWNRRLEDLDLRLHARELDGSKITEAVDQLIATALTRLDDTFSPVINEAIDRLASVGALFAAPSDTSVSIDGDPKTFVIVPNARTSYVVTDYVAIRPTGHVDRGIIAQVTAYDRATGLLDVLPVSFVGVGTYADWIVRATAAPDLEHATRTDNPHETTAAQVGAYTATAVDAMFASRDVTLASRAPLASPHLTGVPTAPTAALGTNTTQIATMAALLAMRSDLVNGAGASLDQLNELAAALGNDANFSATMLAALAKRLRFDAAQTLTISEQAVLGGNGGLIRTIYTSRYQSSTTFIPHPKMLYTMFVALGGGGGGGGAAGSVTYSLGGSGGGSGGISMATASRATIGASRPIVIGAGGAGAAPGGNGNWGGDTSVTGICLAGGGGPGLVASINQLGAGGAGGGIGSGDFAGAGGVGGSGHFFQFPVAQSVLLASGAGANSPYGAGGPGAVTGVGNTLYGSGASGYGAGGAGGLANQVSANAGGGYGAPGLVIATQFCSE